MENWEDWQKLFQFGTIVIWPPDVVREIVNLQRQRYDPVSQSYCETHISVSQPLLRLLDDEWDRIHQLLFGYQTFTIQYGPLNSFLPYPCIWYEIQPREYILEIRNALHKTGFFNLDMKLTTNFIPHMTITEGLSGPPVDETLLQLLQEESREGSFQCTELAYIYPDEQFCFNVEKKFPLRDIET